MSNHLDTNADPYSRRPSIAPSLAMTLVDTYPIQDQDNTSQDQHEETDNGNGRGDVDDDCDDDQNIDENNNNTSINNNNKYLTSTQPQSDGYPRRDSAATDITLFTPITSRSGLSPMTPLTELNKAKGNDLSTSWNHTASSSRTRVDIPYEKTDGLQANPEENEKQHEVTTDLEQGKPEITSTDQVHENLKSGHPGLYNLLEQEGLVGSEWREMTSATSYLPSRLILLPSPNPNPRSEQITMPMNFSTTKKTITVVLASWITILVCMAASGFSTGAHKVRDEFGLIELEGMEGEDGSDGGWIWGTFGGLGLYLLGFAFGPMFLAPASEVWGRRPVYLVSWFLFCLCQIPIALATNFGMIAAFRFLSGFVGSAPLSNVAGTITDILPTAQSGYAIGLYALASVIGPALGSVAGGYPTERLGWRALYWGFLIVFGAHLILIWAFMPETRESIVLKKKIRALRAGYSDLAGNCYAPSEMSTVSPKQLLKGSLTRPYVFLFTEPITYLSGAVNAFALGMIFLSNEAFPLVFGRGNGGHGWTSYGAINMTFLSYVVGSILAFALQPLQQRAYTRSAASSASGKCVPESRWWLSRFAVPLLPIGLQIAAWTSYPEISWVVPLVGFACFGFAFYSVVVSIFGYMMDSYGSYSASAMSGVVLSRNIVCAVLPLAARPMFKSLGNQWALFTLSMLSCLLVPIPWFLYYKGKTIRRNSPFCREHMVE